MECFLEGWPCCASRSDKVGGREVAIRRWRAVLSIVDTVWSQNYHQTLTHL